VYLPSGNWYELFTDHQHQGNSEIVADCPIDQLPVYVRGSSIIPMREKAGSTTNDHGDVLEIHLYRGTTPTSFVLYEDDGISYEYESGAYSKRLLEYRPQENRFTLHATEGKYTSPFRKLAVYLHGFAELDSLTTNGNVQAIQQKEYRFVQPITNFDPVNAMPEGPKITSLKYITTHYDQKQMDIRW
jgi:alpha-glucosidase